MPIVRKYCPTCKKPAIIMREATIMGVHTRQYECGHMDNVKVIAPSTFTDFTSLDGKKPYKFQVEGAVWALDGDARVLIMDEMGLGKTVQAEMILQQLRDHYKNGFKAIVLVKSGLRIQWVMETMRWLGDDWIPQIINSEKDYIMPGVRVLIMSFDILWRFKDIDTFVDRTKAKCVVIDEVQHIKNSDSKRTNGVRKVCAKMDHIVALSGTPIKNHAGEFFPILNILHPEKFPSKTNFDQVWVDTYWDGYKLKYGGLKHPDRFKQFTEKFIIRRTREEVMPDLPTISRENRFSELGEVVEQAYKDTFKQFQQYYNYGGIDDSAIQRQANILSYLTKMRHLTGIAKVESVVDYVTDFVQETDRKITIFVHHKDVGQAVASRLREMQINDPQTWGTEILTLTADLSGEARQEVVTKFHKPEYRILIASTLASGEGLNLQCCSDCIMMERQWNPANEEQAECRFIRIGQLANKVTATYTIAVGTVDEFFSELVEKKREVCVSALNGQDAPAWEESSLIKELAEVLAIKGGQRWGW